MTPVFTARRQAEEFESGLSGALDLSNLSRRDAAALAPLLDLVGELRAVAPPAPRAEFVADLRERLMAEADSVLVPVDTETEARLRLAPADPRTRRRERRLATVLGAAALVGADRVGRRRRPGRAARPGAVPRQARASRTSAPTSPSTTATRPPAPRQRGRPPRGDRRACPRGLPRRHRGPARHPRRLLQPDRPGRRAAARTTTTAPVARAPSPSCATSPAPA